MYRHSWIGLLLVCTETVAAHGQTFPAPGRLRSVVVEPSGAHALLAVHDTDEIVRVELATGKTVASAKVEHGPVAIALSRDGSSIGCVNSLSKSVSLLTFDTLIAYGVVAVGDGPTDIAAIGDLFAVSCAFDDSVALIDPRRPEHADVIAGITGAPSAVAASSGFLAVLTKAPSALHVFRIDSKEAVFSQPLDETSLGVTGLDNNRFVVATKSSLNVYDAASGKLLKSRQVTVTAIAASGGTIATLSSGVVQVLDGATLEVKTTFPCEVDGRALACGRDAVVVVTPTENRWQVITGVSIPSATPPPVVEQAAPPSESTAPAPAPVTESNEIEAEVVSQVEARAPSPTSPPAAELPKQTTTPEAAQPTKESTPESPPDRFRAKPSNSPTREIISGGERPSTIAEGLRESMTAAPTKKGFEPPDWREPLKNMRAEHSTIPLEDNQPWEAHGNVQLDIDTLSLRSDYFYYNEGLGEGKAEGNVVVTQRDSILTADTLQYTVPLSMPEESPFVLLPASMSTPDPEQRRLTSGDLDGKNVHIVEPDREMTAETLHYDIPTRTGEATNATGRWKVFYFGAAKLRILGPASADGEDVWVTTCDRDPPHYRVRISKASISQDKGIKGTRAQVQIGKSLTPLYWPKLHVGLGESTLSGIDIDSGHSATVGYYLNAGQSFAVTDNLDLGLRLYPTSSAGIGLGVDGKYNYMREPSSPLFRSQGEFHSLYTTHDRGYYEAYHRQELSRDLVLLAQTEQWSDEDFYKDFYYSEFKDRSEPRTFANLTYTQPEYLVTATVRKRTNDSILDTERTPELTHHLLERPLVDNLYVSFDTINGYNASEPDGPHAMRTVNVARLTYDWNITPALNLAPFYEGEASWYSETPVDDSGESRFSNTLGATLQSRFHRTFDGALGFSGFKHIVIPSITYSYRPEPNLSVEDTPIFDTYDSVYGRSRIESKIDNILLGKDAKTSEVWQVARMTLYHGADFSNEIRKSSDYEIEMNIRPRPWWGFQTTAEHHDVEGGDLLREQPWVSDWIDNVYADLFDHGDSSTRLPVRFSATEGDYDRLLSYLFYDDQPQGGRIRARLGYAYSGSTQRVFNKEVLYGTDIQISDKWGIGFEHRYDFERDQLTRQQYQIRRTLHCWEASMRFSDREEGWDVGLALSLVGFPGTRLRF